MTKTIISIFVILMISFIILMILIGLTLHIKFIKNQKEVTSKELIVRNFDNTLPAATDFIHILDYAIKHECNIWGWYHLGQVNLGSNEDINNYMIEVHKNYDNFKDNGINYATDTDILRKFPNFLSAPIPFIIATKNSIITISFLDGTGTIEETQDGYLLKTVENEYIPIDPSIEQFKTTMNMLNTLVHNSFKNDIQIKHFILVKNSKINISVLNTAIKNGNLKDTEIYLNEFNTADSLDKIIKYKKKSNNKEILISKQEIVNFFKNIFPAQDNIYNM